MNFRSFSSVLACCAFGALQAFAQRDTTQYIDKNRRNDASQMAKHYVILISVDGLRADYVNKFHATHLQKLIADGASTDYMLPSYPSLTFPNHYTLVTGLYPAHHGLVDNNFYDSKRNATYNNHDTTKVQDGTWYGGTPLWVLAEQQKMLSASFYWVGSDAAIKGIRPTRYFSYNELIAPKRRMQILREWLELPAEKRPHFITLYFPDVDHAAHTYGTTSRETQNAVQFIDDTIGQIRDMVVSLHLPINIVLVSDHGMADVDTEHTLPIPAALNDTSVCRLVAGATMLHVYMNDIGKTAALYHKLKKDAKDYDVYLATELPASWNYGKKEDRYARIGDIVITTRYPKVFQIGTRRPSPGKHGFDPASEEMHATFIAWGPDIKKGSNVPPFENVNIYPFIARLLGLSYSEAVDGDARVLLPLIQN